MNITAYTREESETMALYRGYVAELNRLIERRAKKGDRLLDAYVNGKISDNEYRKQRFEANTELNNAANDAYTRIKVHLKFI